MTFRPEPARRFSAKVASTLRLAPGSRVLVDRVLERVLPQVLVIGRRRYVAAMPDTTAEVALSAGPGNQWHAVEVIALGPDGEHVTYGGVT